MEKSESTPRTNFRSPTDDAVMKSVYLATRVGDQEMYNAIQGNWGHYFTIQFVTICEKKGQDFK